MPERPTPPHDRAEDELALRERALALLRLGQYDLAESLIRRGDASLQDLTENLRIYQVELEAQAAELRDSQSRLQRALARFESLFQSLPLPAVVVDPLGLVQSANRAAEELLGIGRARAGRAALARWLPEAADRSRLQQAIDQASTRHGDRLQGIALRTDGVPTVCDVYVERLPALADHDAVIVSFVDQTERLESLERLRQLVDELERQQIENRQLAAVARLTGQAVVVTDPQRRIRWVNDAFVRQTGWTLDAVTGRTPGRLLTGPDTDRETSRRIGERLQAGLPVEGAEILNVTRQGRPYWVLLDIQPVFDEHGAVAEFVSVQTDITERRAAEQALRMTEAQLRAIFDAEPHGLIQLRRDGTVQRANTAAAALLGLGGAAAVQTLRERVLPADRGRFDRLFARVITGEQLEMRLDVLDAGGARVPASLRVVPLLRAGQVDSVLAVARDIRDELAAQDARVKAEAAEASSRAKSDFIARMSHELRTPLNAMLGFAQLLDADLGHAPLERQREQLAHMLGAGWHLLAMINDILDLSAIEADRVTMRMEPLALAPLIAEAVEQVRPLAQRRRVTLSVAPDDGARRVLADPVRLLQVMHNLLSNAVKYNRDEGWVRVVCGDDARGAWFEVSDGGPGLSAAQREHLFEPFNRLGAERTDVEGTGIGLVIARRLVLLMGGELELLERPGAGAVFRVGLRAAEGEDERAGTDVADAAGAAAAAGASPLRVLYVEDDEVNTLLVRAMIERQPGWQLEVATTGLEGLRLAREHRPDVLLLDMQLPDLTGLDLRERLLEDPATATLPCVLLTADATESTYRRAESLGVASVQHKPVRLNALVEALTSAVAGVD